MKQDTNHEYLKKLIDFLRDRILPIPDNNWFVKELYSLLAPTSDAKISDIHEQCIEAILTEQANEFYKNFVIDALRPQLVADFIKMEHWRRRNNIQEFCLALYQQIEAVVNYIASDENLNLVWRNIRNKGFLVDYNYNDIKIRWTGGTTIANYIIFKKDNYTGNPELKNLLAMDKYKAILFLIAYNTNVTKNNRSEFDDDFFEGQAIYQIRNQNHRGNFTELSDRIRSSIENPIHSMCYMLGFYVRFIDYINEHYPITNELCDFAEI